MKRYWSKVVLFLILNFIALGLGSLFTKDGVSSAWYIELNKAPWTPPGWMFGVAWTIIMVCFAFYIASLWEKTRTLEIWLPLYLIQWILNTSWNPIFFKLQLPIIGLCVIIALTVLIYTFLIRYRSKLTTRSIFILPYVAWLTIATSLNAYIVFMN